MKLEALIFDVDGTLVDTEELHRQAYNQTFLDFGLGWQWNADDYVRLLSMSGGQARIARHIDLIDLPAADKARLRRLIPAIHNEKTRCYGELIASNSARARPGIARLIGAAERAGMGVGLLASSASANVEALVTAALGNDLRKAVGAVVSADMVARKKPAPDIYELLLSMLRVAAADAVAFEDSGNGLLAAKAAGLFTVLTPTRWTMSQKFREADIVLSSLGDPDDPLNAADAAKVGGPYLELTKLQQLRSDPSPTFALSKIGS